MGALIGDVDQGTVADTPHHQSFLTLTKRADGLVVPTLVRPELTHVQKFVYPDKEKDGSQLVQLRPYRYFAALINAYPHKGTFDSIGMLGTPANELIETPFLRYC